MIVLFDSSVLIAACLQQHPKHQAAFDWLKKAKQKRVEGIISSHSLLETFSVLTRAPFKPKISPQAANEMLQRNIVPYNKLISIAPSTYPKLIALLSTTGLHGVIVYDAQIVQCAAKANAKKIITANQKDFQKLADAFDLNIEIVGI